MTQDSASARFIALDTYDIRFPTSRSLDGSDAMNPDPDYSAAYLVLRTDAEGALEGHGFTFTIGRGNDVQVAAISALREHVLGRSVDDVCADPGSLSRTLIGDSQLRWLGPEKGVMHMAIGAVDQRRLGPGRQARGQAAVAAAGRRGPRVARLAGRLPVPDRRPDLRRRRRPAETRQARRRRARSAALLDATATRPTPPRRAGSATPTRS